MKHPLMSDNISEDDLKVLVDFLSQDPQPILTNNKSIEYNFINISFEGVLLVPGFVLK